MKQPTNIEQSIYTVAGSVKVGGGVYIPRQADDELMALCRDGTFAYILTARQMGKSSLSDRTAERLGKEGICSAKIELYSTQATAEQWYFGLIFVIRNQLKLRTNVIVRWKEHAYLSIAERLTLFFTDIVLAEVDKRVVIFIDEIDTTLSLDFTDDFFAAIRALYNARASNPELQRLSFVLIGVATPSDLIHDPKRTPFNLGQRVELSDFTFDEALPLADGLSLPPDQAHEVLRWALGWTGGHPYLTQRLCRALVASERDIWTEAAVDEVVRDTFFGEQMVLRGHQGPVWSVGSSPDGKQLVSGSQDGTIRVWDAASGAGLLVLRGHTVAVYDVQYSPDGKWIASAGRDDTIHIDYARTEGLLAYAQTRVTRQLTDVERAGFGLPPSTSTPIPVP